MSYTNPLAYHLATLIQPEFTNRDGSLMRLDADPVASAAMFLERQLTEIRSKIVNTQYAPLKALSFVPKATDVSISAAKFVWFSYNKTGIAEIIAPGRKALPRVDVHGSEHTGSVVSLGAAYGWSVTDLREAARLKVDLPTKKAESARTAIARGIDSLIRTGYDPESGQVSTALGGLVNYPEVGKALTMHNWFLSDNSTTPEMMVQDLNALVWQTYHDTKGLYVANRLLMASKLYEKAQMTKMSSASSVSVLRYFLDNSDFITGVDPWYALNGDELAELVPANAALNPPANAGAPTVDSGTGVGTTTVRGSSLTNAKHRVIAYQANPEVVEAVVPIEFEQFPAQMEGLECETACHARCGGVKVYQPKAFQYGDFSAKTAV